MRKSVVFKEGVEGLDLKAKIIGLQKSIEIIDKELEFARAANPQMALGMLRIRELIEKEMEEN